MWEFYVRSTRDHIGAADPMIIFDKFHHVAKHFHHAVDQVERSEYSGL
jgi:hypothetical protein